MGRLRVKRYGTRAEVMNGTARMTQGRLTKNDFVYNDYGYIVSKKKSKDMKGKNNPLRKRGLLQSKKSKGKKGKFGPLSRTKKSKKSNKKSNTKPKGKSIKSKSIKSKSIKFKNNRRQVTIEKTNLYNNDSYKGI